MRARGLLTMVAATLAATVAASGCSPGTEPLDTSSGLTFTADPAAR